MKTTVQRHEFVNDNILRQNFSYKGLVALWNWIEEYEEDTDTETEFDPIAICCDFTEYDDLQEIQKELGEQFNSIETLQDYTIVIEYNEQELTFEENKEPYYIENKGIILQNF